MKWCNQCQKFKYEDNFYYDKATQDKLQNRCMSCSNTYAKKYYKEHAQAIKIKHIKKLMGVKI